MTEDVKKTRNDYYHRLILEKKMTDEHCMNHIISHGMFKCYVEKSCLNIDPG